MGTARAQTRAETGSPSRAPRRRRSPGQGRPLGTLHLLAGLLTLSQPRKGDGEGTAIRRRRQRLALVRQLLDPLPVALRPAGEGAERFWGALRWGGVGLLLAHWLGR